MAVERLFVLDGLRRLVWLGYLRQFTGIILGRAACLELLLIMGWSPFLLILSVPECVCI